MRPAPGPGRSEVPVREKIVQQILKAAEEMNEQLEKKIPVKNFSREHRNMDLIFIQHTSL